MLPGRSCLVAAVTWYSYYSLGADVTGCCSDVVVAVAWHDGPSRCCHLLAAKGLVGALAW